MDYCELITASNFSFLHGASHPEDYVIQAKHLGYGSIAITDHNTMAGIVRAHLAAKEHDFRLVIGTRLILNDGPIKCALAAYPLNKAAYGRLSDLLTLGNRRAEKGNCHLSLEDLSNHQRDLVLVYIPGPHASSQVLLRDLAAVKECVEPKLLSIAMTLAYRNNQLENTRRIVEASTVFNIPLLATNDAVFHHLDRRPLQDVLTCIREGCDIRNAGFRLEQNAERYLKAVPEMHRLFRDYPQAISRALEVSEMLRFSLAELRYEYPREICPADQPPLSYLTRLTWEGAGQRYPSGVPEKVKKLIQDEITLIHELNYEKYFLTCYDIVRFARERGILCQGRGAAANSAVCFCLGITAVDPSKIDLLFARFVSKERNEPPDIDIDFEHERREEVIQYIYEKYGRERAGITAEVITYRHRSALRDVGKALGLSLEQIDKLAKLVHGWTSHVITRRELLEIGLDPDSPLLQNIFRLASELLRFPRHLGQHVGGFIISEKPLTKIVPILNASMPNRTIIEWDKDDIETLGMLKIDVLGLGMLSCIRRALELVNERRVKEGKSFLELYNIPADDPEVYDMICAADTIGVFQIESRAQMSMLPRIRPRCFYDLVIEVAIVRPGPIQGGMIHPYLARRSGKELPYFPDQRVREVLGKTLGVPLFQEQAMRLAIMLANFSPGEAEQLRRAMAAWKRDPGRIATFTERITKGMLSNGYSEEFARCCVDQIKGFSEYGFPESHAASFALLVYASAWLKRHHPAEFAAALLNSQPMGFYSPSQIIQDAKNHGIKVLPIDVNYSDWESSIEGYDHHGLGILRCGMRLVRGLNEEQARMVAQDIRRNGRANSPFELWTRIKRSSPLQRSTLQILSRADAFRSMRLDRRQALWEIKALPADIRPLDARASPLAHTRKAAPLKPMSKQQSMFEDYRSVGFSLDSHPISFIRAFLNARRVSTIAALKARARQKERAAVGGIAIFRQRPATAKGVVFVTIEDETGMGNLIVRPVIFEKFQRIVLSSSCVLAEGSVERIGSQLYINVQSLESLDQEVLKCANVPLPNRSFSY